MKNNKPQDITQILISRVAKWWIPDDVIVIDQMPNTVTGKIKKVDLRSQFKNHLADKLP